MHVQSWRETYRGLLPDAYLARMSEEAHARRFAKALLKPGPDDVTLAVADRWGLGGYAQGGPSRRGVSGEAEVSRGGRIVAELGPGDYFGELGLLDPALRDATVTARTPMELVVLAQWDFEQALEEAPGMTRRLLAGMAQRLRTLDTGA